MLAWELGPVRNARRMALSYLCIWRFCIYSHHQCLQYVSSGSRKVLSGSCCYIFLLRKQVCGLAEHVYVKSHWLKGPSPVRSPIGSRSVEIEGNPSMYISVDKIKVLSSMIRAANASKMQTMYVWRSMCAYRLSLVQNLRERKDQGVVIQFRDLRNLSSVRICVLPGCSIRMCTLLFGYNKIWGIWRL
jgi:hypothetical protein